MNTRLRLAMVLVGVAGVLIAGAGAVANAQSGNQRTGQTQCGPVMGNTGGMGMMGGMNHYGPMDPEQCQAQIGEHNLGQCQGMATSGMTTQHYAMAQTQNMTRTCD